jgi:hypothetical protein
VSNQRWPGSRSSPWSPELLIRVLSFNAVGLILAIAGWYNAAGSDRPRTQLTWIEVGVAGFAIAAVGDGMWVLRGRRALATAARELFGPDLAELLPQPPGAVDAPVDAAALLSAPGTIRYHRPGCILLRGHQAEAMDLRSRAAHERSGRRACEVCQP